MPSAKIKSLRRTRNHLNLAKQRPYIVPLFWLSTAIAL